MTTVYCMYSQTRWVTREADPTDDWDAGDEDGDYEVTGVSLMPGWRDSIDSPDEIKAGDIVWAVWVVYGTGSTFGSSGGEGQILTVTKDAELAVAANEWADGKGTWPKELGDEPYKNWTGYFEWLQHVRIETFVVQS